MKSFKEYDINNSIDNQTLITPKKQDPLYEILLGLYKDSFKVSQVTISQEKDAESIKVNYPEYQKVIDQDFPKNIDVFTKGIDGTKRISIDYKSVDANTPLSFPYKIPQGYTEFQLK